MRTAVLPLNSAFQLQTVLKSNPLKPMVQIKLGQKLSSQFLSKYQPHDISCVTIPNIFTAFDGRHDNWKYFIVVFSHWEQLKKRRVHKYDVDKQRLNFSKPILLFWGDFYFLFWPSSVHYVIYSNIYNNWRIK